MASQFRKCQGLRDPDLVTAIPAPQYKHGHVAHIDLVFQILLQKGVDLETGIVP